MPKYAVLNFLGTEKWQGHVQVLSLNRVKSLPLRKVHDQTAVLQTSMQVLTVKGSVWEEFKVSCLADTFRSATHLLQKQHFRDISAASHQQY